MRETVLLSFGHKGVKLNSPLEVLDADSALRLTLYPASTLEDSRSNNAGHFEPGAGRGRKHGHLHGDRKRAVAAASVRAFGSLVFHRAARPAALRSHVVAQLSRYSRSIAGIQRGGGLFGGRWRGGRPGWIAKHHGPARDAQSFFHAGRAPFDGSDVHYGGRRKRRFGYRAPR